MAHTYLRNIYLGKYPLPPGMTHLQGIGYSPKILKTVYIWAHPKEKSWLHTLDYSFTVNFVYSEEMATMSYTKNAERRVSFIYCKESSDCLLQIFLCTESKKHLVLKLNYLHPFFTKFLTLRPLLVCAARPPNATTMPVIIALFPPEHI